jgi:single-strand DNA-binding protein
LEKNMAITPTSIVGNLTSDPELKYTTNQKAQLKFSIAVNDNYTDASGEKIEKTSYFNVVAWGYLAENSANVLEKGMGVVVVGTLDQRSWEDKDSGQKRSTIEIKAMEIGIRTGSLESVERRRANSGDSSSKPTPPRTKQTVPADEPF